MTKEELYRCFGPKLVEAVVLVIKDDSDETRSAVNNLKAALDNTRTLLGLPVLPDIILPERTNQQIIDALENKLSNIPDYDWMNE